jgi:predicted RNA-binding Zn-ribbon protein involved in translation (DUF1610 family)
LGQARGSRLEDSAWVMTNDNDARVRSLFQQRVFHRQRLFFRYLIPLIFSAVFAVIGSVVSRSSPLSGLAAAGAMTSWLIAMVILLARRRLRCSKCNRNVESQVARLCPECGAESIEKGKWYQTPHCRSCGATFVTGTIAGKWTIRYCTHCGVLLHEAGARI